jgi:3-oxoacyl-[acyl-carrier protein] reductase
MNRQRPVALVTGGCRGIGLGIARALAAKGFDLAITDRESDDAVIVNYGNLAEKWLSLTSDLAALIHMRRLYQLS